MDSLLNIVQLINSTLSDYILITLLIGTGILFTIRTRFVQIRCFGEGMRQVFGKFSLNGGKQDSGLNSFQALTTAVAAQVGTGNIVGASGAILAGGPGAIFWMWIIAFLGMSTIYAEAVLAQETRIKEQDGTILGGPVYYIKRAFPNGFGKFLAGFFAIATIISLGFIGCMVQANSIGETCNNAFGIPTTTIGVLLVIFAAIIFLGGVSRLGTVTEKLVPVMAILYLLGGLIVLSVRIQFIPETFAMIFKYAFTPSALIGGGVGAALKIAISQGVKRGLFSNEAGMGSTPHAHALANVKNPHEQGVVAMIGVFIDTFVVLTMTALIVISTLYTGNGPLANATGDTWEQQLASSGLTKTNLVQRAFESILDKNARPTTTVTLPDGTVRQGTHVSVTTIRTVTHISADNIVTSNTTTETKTEDPNELEARGVTCGNIFVAICLFFFAFSTILSWNYFGRINFRYLFGAKAMVIYSVLAICFIFMGTVMKNDLVWELQDMFNQLMVLPNVLALLTLSGLVAAAAKRN